MAIFLDNRETLRHTRKKPAHSNAHSATHIYDKHTGHHNTAEATAIQDTTDKTKQTLNYERSITIPAAYHNGYGCLNQLGCIISDFMTAGNTKLRCRKHRAVLVQYARGQL